MHPNESLLSDIPAVSHTSYENTKRQGALFCRSGTWMEILDDRSAESEAIREQSEQVEHVRGTNRETSRFVLLEFISVAFGLISIRGVESDRYLCMNKGGMLYASKKENYTSECVFMEEMLENYYNLYSSCAYGTRKRPWYVALRRTGRSRKGRHTRKKQKSSHFLALHIDEEGTEDDRPQKRISQATDSSGENWLERLTWKWAGFSFTTPRPMPLAVFDRKRPVVLSDILSNSINKLGSRKKYYEYMKRKDERLMVKDMYQARRQATSARSHRLQTEDSALVAIERLQRGELESEHEFSRRKQRLRRLLREEQRRQERRQELKGLRLRHMRRRVLRHLPPV
ncbi:Fibroblast growth factor family protein [Aphelenchoides avenae]|nr:Fibroblast growth factor family protein [Aphelenchus avenae]